MSARGELGLSFLDTLSCGLGAMILLFLIFATMEHRGAPRPTRRRAEAQLEAPPGPPYATGGIPAEQPWLYELAVKSSKPDAKMDLEVKKKGQATVCLARGPENWLIMATLPKGRPTRVEIGVTKTQAQFEARCRELFVPVARAPGYVSVDQFLEAGEKTETIALTLGGAAGKAKAGGGAL